MCLPCQLHGASDSEAANWLPSQPPAFSVCRSAGHWHHTVNLAHGVRRSRGRGHGNGADSSLRKSGARHKLPAGGVGSSPSCGDWHGWSFPFSLGGRTTVRFLPSPTRNESEQAGFCQDEAEAPTPKGKHHGLHGGFPGLVHSPHEGLPPTRPPAASAGKRGRPVCHGEGAAN